MGYTIYHDLVAANALMISTVAALQVISSAYSGSNDGSPEPLLEKVTASCLTLPMAVAFFFQNSMCVFTAVMLEIWKIPQGKGTENTVEEVANGTIASATDAAASAKGSENHLMKDPTSKSLKLPAQRNDLRRPAIAWPTIILSIFSVSAWLGFLFGGSFGLVSPAPAFIGSAVSTYFAVTGCLPPPDM